MGRLLSDVSEKMHAKASEGARNRLKLLVHSTHDTSLAGICKTLDVFDEKYVLSSCGPALYAFAPPRDISSGNVAQRHSAVGRGLSFQVLTHSLYFILFLRSRVRRWPAFTSSVTFELFSKTTTSQSSKSDSKNAFSWQTVLAPFRPAGPTDQHCTLSQLIISAVVAAVDSHALPARVCVIPKTPQM